MNCKYYVFIAVVIGLFSISSCNKSDLALIDENDTTRGIWGQVLLYDEFGNPIVNCENISVKLRCIDTLTIDDLGVPSKILDTTIQLYTNNLGKWQISRAPRGYYSITASKDGFATNSIYNYVYDTSRADTLDMIYLAVKPQGSVRIDSISVNGKILEISRTISFENVQNFDYLLSSWYFFDTVPEVSNSQYIYSYVSGASYAKGGTLHSLTIQKPLSKLYESGITEGKVVYVRAYIDNAKYIKYQIGEKSWVYPNVSEGSSVFSFILPIEE